MMDGPEQQRARIRADLRLSLPTSYFTLISLIQGTAIGFLGNIVAENHRTFGLAQWVSAVATLLIIIQVWNEYRMSVTVWAGVPVLQDSVIPFTLGASEYWLIFAIPATRNWLLALTFVALGGIVAYVHVQRLALLPENEEMAVHRPYMRGQLVLSLAYSVVFGGLWLLHGRGEGLSSAGGPVVAVTMVVGLLVRAELHWRRVLGIVSSWHEQQTGQNPTNTTPHYLRPDA